VTQTEFMREAEQLRRHLPSDLRPPATDASLEVVLDEDAAWLEPLPDALVFVGQTPGKMLPGDGVLS
jgi:hypothetical protein